MDVKPRRSPRQARARVTVDAIVEATTQVLLEEGYDRLTTARAAERAGVSVGSLYQYFPNKAALVFAVIDRCCENFLITFEGKTTHRATLTDCIQTLIDVSLVSHHLAPDLHRIVNALVPRVGVSDRVEVVSRATAKAIESMLRKHAEEISPDIDLGTAATIIETMLEALAHRVLLTQQVQSDMVVVEVTRLLMNYLAVRR